MSTNHTPGPWHYISGAVYAQPEDADRPDRCAIAMRASTSPRSAEYLSPTTKDANMRHIVACVNAHDELLAALRGLLADPYLADPINADRMAQARAAVARFEGF